MTHQFGDQYVQIGGQKTRLRLTVGALALLSLRLDITGPEGLAQLLRGLSPDQAQVVLGCLIHRAAPSLNGVDGGPKPASSSELAAALPVICTLFEAAFHGG